VTKLKCMSRLAFAAFASVIVSTSAAAQKVPARDLFEFPLGLMADAPPFSNRMPASLWNPASRAMTAASHAEIGVAGLTTPQAQGVQLDMLAAEYRFRPDMSLALSFAQASVSDILRTEGDPQSLGGEIPYGTNLVSVGVATTPRPSRLGTWSAGVAARYRWATVDDSHGGALSTDAGVIVDRLFGTPLRGAASTFLFSPNRSLDVATYMLAVDAPVLRRDSTTTVRLGYSLAQTPSHGRDDYWFTNVDRRWLDVSGGFDWSTAFGSLDRRLRLGIGLRYASYLVAVAREEGSAGLGANYQFLLTRAIP
jgi:hypothetical protein